jgi:hypothetical protein
VLLRRRKYVLLARQSAGPLANSWIRLPNKHARVNYLLDEGAALGISDTDGTKFYFSDFRLVSRAESRVRSSGKKVTEPGIACLRNGESGVSKEINYAETWTILFAVSRLVLHGDYTLRPIGYLLIIVGCCVWIFGYNHAFSLCRKRLGEPKPSLLSLPPMSFWKVNGSERKRLATALIAAILLANIGGWILRG